MLWVQTNQVGVITSFGTVSDGTPREAFLHMLGNGGDIHLNVEADMNHVSTGDKYHNGILTKRPTRPSDLYDFNEESFSWVLRETALEEAKESSKALINAARNAAERKPFIAFGKPFDADDKAIQRLLGAAQAALFAKQSGSELSIEWTCADNSTIVLTADELTQVPVIMAQQADAIHQKARALKAAVDSATTLEEINAIHW